MTSVSCSIRQVNRLRRAAERARRILAEDPDLSPEERLSDGWSTSPYDPHTLRRVGEALTPLYVKTVVHAAKSAAWRAR